MSEDAFVENLYFELSTIDKDGNNNIYTIPMTVNEIKSSK